MMVPSLSGAAVRVRQVDLVVLGDDAAGDEAVDWFARALEAVTGRDRRERAATA
jgi:hypothetical protein